MEHLIRQRPFSDQRRVAGAGGWADGPGVGNLCLPVAAPTQAMDRDLTASTAHVHSGRGHPPSLLTPPPLVCSSRKTTRGAVQLLYTPSRTHPNWMIDDCQLTSYSLPMVAGVVVCGTHGLVWAGFFAVRRCKLNSHWSRWATSVAVLLSARQFPDLSGPRKRLCGSVREELTGRGPRLAFASSGLRSRS